MHLISLPKEFIYVTKHKPIALSAAADQKMQKLKLWAVLKQTGTKDPQISQLLRVSRATLYR